MVSSAYQGFSPFPRYNRFVHWLGYCSGFVVWILGYLLVVSVLPFDGLAAIGIANVVACILTGLLMGLLFVRAIGSPWANVLLPIGTPFLVPGVIYTYAVPDIFVPGIVTGIPQAVVIGAGALVGLQTVFITISWQYRMISDIRAWERTVLPYSVRMIEDQWLADSESSDRGLLTEWPHLRPRTEDHVELRFNAIGGLFGLFVGAPVIASSTILLSRYGDWAFVPIMCLAIGVVLHWSLEPDE